MKVSSMYRIIIIGLLFCILSLVKAQVDRDMVILENFGGTWCTNCPGAAMGAEDLVANDHDVAVIEYHVWDEYANDFSQFRFSLYEALYADIVGGQMACPTAVFDGQYFYLGGDQASSLYSTYLPFYEYYESVLSSFTIAINGENTGLDYTVSVIANKVASTSSTNIVLHLVLTESQIAEEWQGQTELNFVERLMIPDQYGTALDFSTGDAQTVNLGFTLDPGWASSNCELVAFIQDNNSKEILQGTKVNLTEMEALEVEKFTNTIPEFFHLYQNYPNPFNASTTIQYELKENSAITISIFNIHGKEIDMIVNDYQQAGEHSITWNGQYVPSGIYFIRLSSGEIVQTRKAVLLK
ncbi:MAG: T9SS type A sorting domain-containing protein [Candidatus Marinimicrobia bacterium]|nr:T9SS type A sorting domain-containing protein [Candidatus Neomarinimicrobiota bacterium]